ncbi:unnamed protein product [Tuber melanosporum]|uniref:(Perigord truffle) hypothetical protein n=1 Tax=Tuber melanosporum (strain Mel28) TaxID=656061 RepID=D5GIS3_TUBMM|nr:uncharacterized protein GSTUM_00008644001 [Tuber melanosporum]CAZ84416.1 unnamed protein product [Tuber melanosporum]
MAETVVEAPNVDEEAGGLRVLLEEDLSDSRSLMDNTPSLMAAGSTSPQVDVNAMVVAQQHAAAHQARAAAALEQADAAEERNHRQNHPQLQHVINNAHSQAPEKVPVSSTPPPPSTVTQDLPQQTVPHAAPIKIPSRSTVEEENGMPGTPGTSDLALLVVSPSNICLCQQPARIPRPRNAFILFRQHNQAAVVAKHPGKPNPEISKIIGEMWRESSQEAKNLWQRHADEEKKKHFARYPEYRYQPRRNGKKNAAAAAGASGSASGGAISPPLETAICSTCGGRTGSLSTPQTPATPGSAVPKTPGLSQLPHSARTPTSVPPPSKRRRAGTEDDAPRCSTGSPAGPVGEQAGIEALLQLGNLGDDENIVATELQASTKRQKMNGGSPTTDALTTSPLQHSLYPGHFPLQSHNPNIDPFLQQNSFEQSMPSLDADGSLTSGPHQISNFSPELPEPHIPKPISPMQKIRAFNCICKPLPTGAGFSRLPVIAIEGDDIEAVSELFHAVAKLISNSDPIDIIDEPDISVSEQPHKLEESTEISDGLLMPAGDGNDLDSAGVLKDAEDDLEAAKYLDHVASWRRRCLRIKNAVMHSNGASQRMVLVNRYMVSRSNSAYAKLSSDGLSALQHWQWCATVWRGCIGPDMTIYVVNVPNGSIGGDAVEAKEGGKVVFVKKEVGELGRKAWEEKVIRRLAFEVGEIVRSLKGFMG